MNVKATPTAGGESVEGTAKAEVVTEAAAEAEAEPGFEDVDLSQVTGED